MNYRKFGTLDVQVSALGFGAMRLPTLEDGQVDEPAALEMLQYAFDQGVNYVDTAYPYMGGQSEPVVGRALENGYRDRVYLATKMPVWEVNDPADFDRLLNEQLAKLQVEHIDFYLLHALRGPRWPRVRDQGVLAWAEGAIADGRIGHLGFSLHDSYQAFVDILGEYDWEFCQVQHNLLCEEIQVGSAGVTYAGQRGVGLVIMEPLFGGSLADPPDSVREILKSAGSARTLVDLALQWLWNKPGISVVLSGMSALEQVQQNVASASRSGVGTLSEQDLRIVERVQRAYQALNPIPCTKCGYCMPCPNGIDIPRNFEFYNAIAQHERTVGQNRMNYTHQPEEAQAGACIACRECEEKCPQGIPISEWMPRVHARFTIE
jgi:predicted aldo/keto reductase-like oxidoreductase